MKRSATILLAAPALALLAAAPATAADFGLKELDVTFTNEDGSAATQAGSHPFAMTTTLDFNTEQQGSAKRSPTTKSRTSTIGQSPGLVGNPTAVPRCSTADFVTSVEGRASCPDATAVGIAAVKAEFTALPAEHRPLPPRRRLQPRPAARRCRRSSASSPSTCRSRSTSASTTHPPYNVVAS